MRRFNAFGFHFLVSTLVSMSARFGNLLKPITGLSGNARHSHYYVGLYSNYHELSIIGI